MKRRALLLMLLLILVVACVDVTGLYRVQVDLPSCPVPAPIINDMAQPPSTIAWGCPYQVRLADSSLVTVTLARQ